MGMSVNVYAVTDDNVAQCQSSVTVYESDMIEEIQKLSNDELLKCGYDLHTIEQARNANVKDTISWLRKMSEEELIQRGYSAEEIHKLKSPEAYSMKASEVYGAVTYTIEPFSYIYSKVSDDTTVSVKVSWNWSKYPVCAYTDIIACTTSNNKFVVDNGTGKVNYHQSVNSSVVVAGYTPIVKAASSKHCAYIQIPMTKQGDGIVPYLAKTGFMTTEWKADGKIARVAASCKYGHNEGRPSTEPSASVTEHEIVFSPGSVKTGVEAAISMNLQ